MKKILTVLAVALSVCTLMALLCISSFAADAATIAYETQSGDCKIVIMTDGTMIITGAGRTSDKGFDPFTDGVDDPNLQNPWQKCVDFKVKKVIIGPEVTFIGQYFFARDGEGNQSDCMDELQEVVFSGSRTAPLELGEGAFCKTKLTSITLPDTTTKIGKKCFYKAKYLTSFTAPKSLTFIGGSAFQGCERMTSLTLNSNIKYIAGGAFMDCGNMSSPITVYPGCNYPALSGNGVFEGVKSSEIIIQQGVKTLFSEQFACTRASEVYIPGTVEEIAEDTFRECKRLLKITVDHASHTFWSNDEGTVLYALDKATMTAKVLFVVTGYKTEKDITIEIPATITNAHNETYAVTSISSCAFSGLVDNGDAMVKTVNIKAPITELYNEMLRKSEVTAVTLPATLQKINAQAFKETGITEIVIPANVTVIGSQAFCDCEELAAILFESGSQLKTVGLESFSGCSSVEYVEFLPADFDVLGTDALNFGSVPTIIYNGNTTQWYNLLFKFYTLDAGRGDLADGTYSNLKACTYTAATTGSVNHNNVAAGYLYYNCVVPLGDQISAVLHTVSCDACYVGANGRVAGACAECQGRGNTAGVDCESCDGTGKCKFCIGTGYVKTICNHNRGASACTMCGVPGTGVKIGEVCSVCGKIRTNAFVLDSVSAASCAAYGSATYKCELCGLTAKIPASTKVGDTTYDIGTKPAHTITYTKNGYDHDPIAMACGISNKSVLIQGTVAYPANYNEKFDWVGFICPDCGGFFRIEDGEAVEIFPNLVDDSDNTVLNGNYSSLECSFLYTPNYDGNCVDCNGTKTGVCIYCGRKVKAADPETVVHTGDWTVVQAPTCEGKGYATRKCTACGEYESKVLEATGHAMSAYVPDGNAVCVPGMGTMTSTCANCGLKDTVVDNTTVNPDKHAFVNGKCYFCQLLEKDYVPTTEPATEPAATEPAATEPAATEPAATEKPVVTGAQETSKNNGSGDAVDTGDSLVVVVAVAVMAIGTAVIVKKVK